MQKLLRRNYRARSCARGALGFAIATSPIVHAANPQMPPANFFPIGVAGQQADEFAAWKARGVNTVVGNIATGAWQDFWNDTAVADGLWQIRNPRLNPAQDVGQSYLLAWQTSDLPDTNNVSARTLATAYAQLKAADPTRKVIINLSAANAISETDSISDAAYASYSAATDWISSEVFPVSGLNQPTWIDKTQSTAATAQNPGAGVAKLSTLSGGKKQFAYIETSDRDGTGGNRAPTAAEVRGETWDAIVHGAKGIVYSPQGSKTDDATTADVAAGITVTDALITEYGAVLNAIADNAANTLDLGGGLEATYRIYDGERVYFVLNDSHATINNARFDLVGVSGTGTVALPEEGRTLFQTNGIVTDSFSPYQVRIYESAVPVGGGSVPEPAECFVVFATGVLFVRKRR